MAELTAKTANETYSLWFQLFDEEQVAEYQEVDQIRVTILEDYKIKAPPVKLKQQGLG